MKLTLISHALCPYVQRAVIALKEKEVPYERVDIDLKAKPDWFLAVSPLGKTPVLLVDGTPVFESAVICEFLEDTLEPRLHPEAALERARHRAWMEFSSATLASIWSFYTAPDEEAYAIASATLKERFGQLEKALNTDRGGPYFAGKQFSLIDAAFGPVFRYLDVFDAVSGIDFLAEHPKTQAWRQALSARPSIQAAVGEDYREGLIGFVISQRGVLGRRFIAKQQPTACSV